MGLSLRPKLLKTHNLTFYRQNAGELVMGGGYADDDAPTEMPNIIGSLQPISLEERVNIIPDGYDTDSGYYFRTDAELNNYREGINQKPDYTIIQGREYEVHVFGNWKGFGLNTDHNKYILVALAQPSEIV